jgi:hypothetical protein
MSKNQKAVFTLALGLLVIFSLALAGFWTNFDDKIYIYEGVSMIHEDDIYDLIAEAPNDIHLLEDLDPSDNWVYVSYQFERDDPPSGYLDLLDCESKSDSKKWGGFAIFTAIVGGLLIASLVAVLYLAFKEKEKKDETDKDTLGQ